MLRPHARPTVSGYENQIGKSELFPFCVETSHFNLDQGVIRDVTCRLQQNASPLPLDHAGHPY